MNLKSKNQPVWHELFHKDFVAVYIALALVLLINQVVFSYALKDRDKAGAFTNTGIFSKTILAIGDQTVAAGATDVVLADFYIPDAFGDDSLACGYDLNSSQCLQFIEGDGNLTTGPGSADDGANYLFDLEPYGLLLNTFFVASDGLCSNSLDPITTPLTCLYIDTSCGDGTPTGSYLINSSDPAPCAQVTDSLVVSGITPPQFLHNDTGATSGAYDLGEDIWYSFYREDSVLQVGSDWNNPAPNQWQGDALNGFKLLGSGSGGEGFIDLDPSSDPSSGDGIYSGNTTANIEPVIIDWDNDGLYTSSEDFLLDADGSTTTGPGSNGQVIPDGTVLTPTSLTDGICVNNLYNNGSIIIYIDSSGDCVPTLGDTLIRDDKGVGMAAIIAGLGSYPYTFFPLSFAGFYYDNNPNNGTWDIGAESLWVQNQDYLFYNPGIDLLVEADGTGTSGIGSDDDVSSGLSRGNNIQNISAFDNLCFALSSTGANIEDIYIDGSDLFDNGLKDLSADDCIPGNGGVDVILFDLSSDGLIINSIFGGNPNGTWASGDSAFTYWDNVVADFAYTYGAGSAATESLWLGINFISGAIYSSRPDTDVYGHTIGVAFSGDPLMDLNGVSGPSTFCVGLGCPVLYADADSSGTLTSADTIIEDVGNVQTGPTGVPNGVMDRQAEIFNRATFANAGTLPLGYLKNVRLYADIWWLGGDGICNTSDFLAGTFTNAGDIMVSALADAQYSTFFHGCIVADIAGEIPNGSSFTFKYKLPQMIDNYSNGLYDAGDSGWFSYSSLDGPVGGDIVGPNTIYITGNPNFSGYSSPTVPVDTTPPGIVENIVITANYNGNVSITWQDPTDADLNQILLEETVNGQVLGDYIAKGVQAKTLTGRIVGTTYSYRLRALDNTGNIGSGQYYNIVIPATGETQADVQAIPAPEAPALILQDPTPAGPLPVNVSVGALVKAAYSGTIYFIDQDNRRHTFPNEKTYFSYYDDFSGLQILSDATLAAIPLGSNVTMRPGTWLVKIQSDFKVYAIEPYGVLSWIPSEAVAAGLYGADWATRIVDVEPTFFTDYQMGSAVTANVHPTGAVFSYLNDPIVYYVDEATKRFISSAVFVNNKFQNRFVIRNVSTDIAYANGADWPKLNMDAIMTLR